MGWLAKKAGNIALILNSENACGEFMYMME
jgi:hypothetical protein